MPIEEEILKRLDDLEAENATLREKVARLEGRTPAAVPERVTSEFSPPPNTEQMALDRMFADQRANDSRRPWATFRPRPKVARPDV